MGMLWWSSLNHIEYTFFDEIFFGNNNIIVHVNIFIILLVDQILQLIFDLTDNALLNKFLLNS